VADSPPIAVIRTERGQVLAFFAVLLPVVLLPLAAYAVDAAFVGARAAGVQEAAAEAAEAAAQQLDITALRSRSELRIDGPAARQVATQLLRNLEPEASVDSVKVEGTLVSVTAGEVVRLPFNFLPLPAIKLEGRASARLVPGYDSPSSLVPLPTRTF
jgi:Flp pilus assembly protein TadG